MSAGYSGTPLPRKLGIKPGDRVLVDGAPAGFALSGPEAEAAVVDSKPTRGEYDVAVVFCLDHATLDRRWPKIAPLLTRAGALWICWPMKASGVATDLTENLVRDTALARGLVDVKVCAVDETWSGLKLVRRVADR